MSVWYLTRKQSGTNLAPGTPTGQNQVVQPMYDSTNAPLANVTIQCIVNGGAGTATVQPVGSNDGVNWENQGSAISATSGHGSAVVTSAPWVYWGAIVTALASGATVDTLLSG